MSHQIYFLQTEEDTKEFLAYMVSIDVLFFHHGGFESAGLMYDDVVDEMNSYLHSYIMFPGEDKEIDKKILGAFTGVEYLICSKGAPVSCTYDLGRLYYRSDASNPYNAQMLKLYKKLKAYIRKNYTYYKETWVYCGPHFQEGYDKKQYTASQCAGRPLELR